MEGELELLSLAPAWRKKTGTYERAHASTRQVQDLRHLARGEKLHLFVERAFLWGLSASAALARTAGFFSFTVFFPKLSLSADIRSIT